MNNMTAEEKAKLIRDYVMPPVQPGDIVLHYQDKGSQPEIALVVRVSPRTVTLAIIAEMARSLVPRDGVRHKSDPSEFTDYDAGWWAYTKRTEEEQEQELQLDRIEARLDRLEAPMDETVSAATKKLKMKAQPPSGIPRVETVQEALMRAEAER